MTANNSNSDILATCDRLYAGRGDIRNVEESIEFLQSAKESSFEIDWRLARANFFLGQEGRLALPLRCYRKGIEAGRRAISERPERVEGQFWLGVNLALAAQIESPVKGIVRALQAKRALQKAVKLDAAFHSAGPLRVLARLQHKLPRAFGGGWRWAYENYEKAISIAPGNTVTRIYFAELLLEIGEKEAAQRELEAVLSVEIDPEWEFEIKRDQSVARKMIDS
jgi:hypothetical protein